MPARRRVLPLACALAVDMAGSGLFLPVSLLYFTEVAGLPLGTVGLLLSVAGIASLPVPLIVGHVAHRFRAVDRVLAAQILQGVAFLAYGWAHHPAAVLVVAMIASIGQRLFWSSFFSVVAGLGEPGEDRQSTDRRYALTGMIQMASTGVGILAGGLVVTYGWYQPAVWLNAATFGVSALLLLLVPRDTATPVTGPAMTVSGSAATVSGSAATVSGPAATVSGPAATVSGPVAGGGGYRAMLRDRPYLLLIAVNTVFALCSVFIGVAVPVYLIDALPAPHWLVGPLLAVNTVLLATGQTLAVRLVRPLSRSRGLVLAGVLWVVWALVYAAAVEIPGAVLVPYLMVGLIFFAAADLIHAPLSNALSAAAAPAAQRDRYLAVYQYCFAFASILAPTFFTALYARGPAVPWLALAAVTAVATLAIHLLDAPLTARENADALTKPGRR